MFFTCDRINLVGREQTPLIARRQSLQQAQQASWHSQPYRESSVQHMHRDLAVSKPIRNERNRSLFDERTVLEADDRTPLIQPKNFEEMNGQGNYGRAFGAMSPKSDKRHSNAGHLSFSPSRSIRRRHSPVGFLAPGSQTELYDVNNPPSMPSSPKIGVNSGFDDVMLMGEEAYLGPDNEMMHEHDNEVAVDIDKKPVDPNSVHGDNNVDDSWKTRSSQKFEADVCFPAEKREVEKNLTHHEKLNLRRRPALSKEWPDLAALEDWSQEEKQQLAMDSMRAKRISEPVLVGGRLRPQKSVWHRETEDDPYRWTYFNEELESTIHSQTISGLKQSGLSFEELFIPTPADALDEDNDGSSVRKSDVDISEVPGREDRGYKSYSDSNLREASKGIRGSIRKDFEPNRITDSEVSSNMKRYTSRPTFWLDVLSPTEAEMRVLQRTFGIHGLTIEDIMLQEAREKVELFRNYYFVNYRSFEQDSSSEHYMEPVNMYVVVFREGVLSVSNLSTFPL